MGIPGSALDTEAVFDINVFFFCVSVSSPNVLIMFSKSDLNMLNVRLYFDSLFAAPLKRFLQVFSARLELVFWDLVLAYSFED